jgi:hypothetical protein
MHDKYIIGATSTTAMSFSVEKYAFTAFISVLVGLIIGYYMERRSGYINETSNVDGEQPSTQLHHQQPFLAEGDEDDLVLLDGDEEYDFDYEQRGNELLGGGVEAEINLDAEEAPTPRRYENMTAAEILAARQAEQAEQTGATGTGTSRRGANRVVGKKKTRSLARKDQIRAYNEFVRQQAEADKNAQREYYEKFGDLIDEERRQRQEREAAAAAAKRSELERKRVAEEDARSKAQHRKEILIKSLNSSGKVKLKDEQDRRLAQLIPEGRIVANGEWLVSIDQEQLNKLARAIKADGRISFEKLATVL